jgi:WD40 repeat protein
MNSVEGLAFSPDGRTLASGGDEGIVQLWKVRTHKPIGQSMPNFTGPPVTGVAFGRKGRTVASASGHDPVIWRVRTQKFRMRLQHGVLTQSLAFSPDGRMLAGGGSDIELWKASDGAHLATLRSSELVMSVAFSPNGRILASGDAGGEVRLWSVHNRRPFGSARPGGKGFVFSVAFSPDGETVASGSEDGTVRLWRVHTSQILPRLQFYSPDAVRVAFAPDGRLLAAVSAGEVTKVWTAGNRRTFGKPRPARDNVEGPMDDVVLSPDGTRALVYGESSDAANVWTVATGKGHRLNTPGSFLAGAFSPDSSLVATGNNAGRPRAAGQAQIWKAGTGQADGTIDGQTRQVTGIAFGPGNKVLATGGDDGVVRFWDVTTGKLQHAVKGDSFAVSKLTFSPDGKLLAAGGDTLRILDVAKHRQVGQPLGDVEPRLFTGAVFSPDGRTLAGADGSLRLWDVKTHEQLGYTAAGFGDSVAFSPDGRTLAGIDREGKVRVWPSVLWRDLTDLHSRVCSLVWGNLTSAEWTAFAPGLPQHATCANRPAAR